MHQEINAAVSFLAAFFQEANFKSEDDRKLFLVFLAESITQRVSSHWDTREPLRGSAYRCISIFGKRVDAIVAQAVRRFHLDASGLPSDLHVWIDPFLVSYRIGERSQVSTVYFDREKVHLHQRPCKEPPNQVCEAVLVQSN